MIFKKIGIGESLNLKTSMKGKNPTNLFRNILSSSIATWSSVIDMPSKLMFR